MRIILGSLQEEFLAISLVVLSAGSLGCERRCNTLWMSHLQGTIHLVGRDMIEALALITLWQTLPIDLGSLEQRQGTHHIGLSESERILDTAVHMTLCSQMDNTVHLILLHQFQHQVEVTNVTLHEGIVWLILNILEVS